MEKLNKSFISVSDLAKFNACVLEVLNKEALIKKKFIRANKALFMTRKLKKAIKANADKCHLLLSIKEKLKANISSDTIMSSAKASQKLWSLSRVSLYISLNQSRMIMQSNHSLNNNNRIHEKAFRIVYRDKNFSRTSRKWQLCNPSLEKSPSISDGNVQSAE